MIKLNEYYKNTFLTAGATRDNFVFENCSNEFINIARDLLSQENNNTKPCNITIDKSISERLDNSIKLFDLEQKQIIARDFLNALILQEVHKYTENQAELDSIKQDINNALSQNRDKILSFIQNSPIPYFLERKLTQSGKIEINIFLQDMQNKHLQQAINSYLSSRSPYSIKLFTNEKFLCTYYDLAGNIIQSPHDYMLRTSQIMYEEPKSEM